MNKLYFDMAIVDEHGKVHARIKREIPSECAFIGWRPVEELKLGVGSFADTVQLLKVKQLRKDLLRQAAEMCGVALAEHLEDREGWHGQSRVESTTKLYEQMTASGERM
jgi:hypothetical protein